MSISLSRQAEFSSAQSPHVSQSACQFIRLKQMSLLWASIKFGSLSLYCLSSVWYWASSASASCNCLSSSWRCGYYKSKEDKKESGPRKSPASNISPKQNECADQNKGPRVYCSRACTDPQNIFSLISSLSYNTGKSKTTKHNRNVNMRMIMCYLRCLDGLRQLPESCSPGLHWLFQSGSIQPPSSEVVCFSSNFVNVVNNTVRYYCRPFHLLSCKKKVSIFLITAACMLTIFLINSQPI